MSKTHQTSKNEDDIKELHPKERELLRLIRTRFRYGRLTIITHDGVPQKVEETVKYDAL